MLPEKPKEKPQPDGGPPAAPPKPKPADIMKIRGLLQSAVTGGQPWAHIQKPEQYAHPEFLQYQKQVGKNPTFQALIGNRLWEQQKPTNIALRQLGYLPTAWEDPRTVVKYYNFLRAAPKDWKPPDWLDPNAVEQAYKWFEFRNGGKPPDSWKFLPTDDPARGWLQTLQEPPTNLKMPTDQWYTQMPAGPQPEVITAANPAEPQTSPVLDWTKAGPGWMKLAYYAMSNPATAPLVQGLMMAVGSAATVNIPGIGMGLAMIPLGYAQESKVPFLREAANVIGTALTWGMQALEQVQGMGEQLLPPTKAMPLTLEEYKKKYPKYPDWILDWAYSRAVESSQTPLRRLLSLSDPEVAKATEQNLREILQHPKATWEAAGLYYESRASNTPIQNVGPLLQWCFNGFIAPDEKEPPKFAEPGQVWVLPEPVYDSTGNLTGWNYHPNPVTVPPGFTLEDARKRVLGGENPDQVLAEFRQIYGFSGAFTDLATQIIMNPLIMAPGLEKAGAAGTADVVGRIARASGHEDVALAADRWYKAATVSGGGLVGRGGVLDSYRTLIRSTVPVDELTALDRYVGKLTPEGTIKGMAPAPEKIVGAKGLLGYIANLTSESKAHVWHETVLDNWKQIALQSGMDPAESVRLWSAYANGDMQALRDAGATYLMSPEAYTVLPSAKAFLPEAVDLLTEWQTSQGARDVVVRLADILGEKPADTVKEFLEKDPRLDFSRLVERAKASQSPQAKAFLEDVQAGRVTPEAIQDAIKVFEGGKVALDPQEWAAKFINHLSDHTGEWLADFYHLKPDSPFFQVARTLKSAQSLMLLSLSPSYAINNNVNNAVSLPASGLGFLPDWRVQEIMDRFGWTGEMAPERLSAGIGAAAEGTGLAGAPRPGENAIRAATTPENFVNDARRVISSVNEKVGLFSKISQAGERLFSRMAWASAAEKFHGRMWRVNVGFDAMPAGLELALKNIDPSYPGLIYRAIESGYRFEDVQNALAKGASSRNIQTYINDAAAKLGMQPGDTADALATVGVLDYLNGELPKASSEQQIRQVFANADRVFNDYVDRIHAQSLRAQAGMTTQRIQTEGFAAVNDMWTDMFSREIDVKNISDLAWDKAYSEANANWENTGLRRQILGAAAAEQQARYRRFYEWQEASMKGVIEALGMDEPTRRDYLADMVEIHQKRGEFFKLKSEEVRQFFNTEFKSAEERNAAWYSLMDEQNKRYAQLISDEGVTAARMDMRLEGWFEQTFGPGSGAGVKSWRAGLRFLLDQRGRSVVAFRDSIKDLLPAERDAAWQKFKPLYFQDFVGEKQMDAEGLAHIWQKVTGQETVPARIKNVMGEQPAEAPVAPEVAPLAQAELITPETAQQVQATNAAAEQAAQNVRGVANNHNFPTADANGDPIPGADIHLARTIRKYGGPEAKRLIGEITPENAKNVLALIPPEMAEAAFTEKARIDAMQGTLDQELGKTQFNPEQFTGVDRRVPAFQRLREKFPTMSDTEKAQALGWILNKTMVDPTTGLETIYSQSLESPPEGWVHAISDLNGLGGVNDHWGHPAGDAVLSGMGGVVREEVQAVGGRAFRVGGDEVNYWFPSQEAADQALSAIDSRFKDATINFEIDGKPYSKKGFSVSYGTGRNPDLADIALRADKASREATGERTAKGEIPGSVVDSLEAAGIPAPQQVPGLPGAAPQQPPAVTIDPLAARRAAVLDLIQTKPLAEVPEVLRAPLTDILTKMMDEVTGQRKRTLLEAIRDKGGLNIKYIEDVTGEAKAKREWGPGFFTRDGLGLDDMATELASEEGYSINLNDPADSGGVNQLSAMIRDELAGNKHFSAWEDTLPEQLPDWYKGIKGGANKVLTIKRSITNILNGLDNPAAKLPPSAVEAAIKSEAFNRLGQFAAEDGTLAQATGFPYDAGKFMDRVDVIAASVSDADLGQLQAMNEAMDALTTRAPEDLDPAAYDHWQQVKQAISDRMDDLEKRATITQAHAQAEQSIVQAEQRAHVAWNRQAVAEHFRQAGLPPEQADAMAEMFDGAATWFQKETGKSAADFYDLALEAIKHGTPEDLQALLDKVRGGEVQFQADKIYRAAIDFTDSMKAIYTIFDTADASSAPHEFGHHLRRMLYATFGMTGTQELLSDIETVEQFAGVKNGKWTKTSEERFAKGFERYLAEGIAPTPALVRVFQNFKAWLLGVYHAITGSKIDVPLNDETRRVFDKMLGADLQPVVSEEVVPNALVQGPGFGFAGESVQGNMFTPQQYGLGLNVPEVKKTISVTPEAPAVSIPGKTTIDGGGKTIATGDVVRLMDGERARVMGVAENGDLILTEGDSVPPTTTIRVAGQESMFGNPGELIDFGEKLGGARKDKAAATQAQLAQVAGISSDDLAKMKMSEIFPKSIIDNIEDTRLAALAQTIRDVIPSKPRDSWRIKRWVEQVKTVQGLIDIANQRGVDEVISRLRASPSLTGVADKVELLQQVSRDQWSRIGDVQDYPKAYTYKDGKQVPAPFASAKVDGATLHADNLEALILKVADKLGTSTRPKTTMKFEVRGSGNKYFINKAGDSLYRKLMEFTDPKEALDYRSSHYDDLVAAWEKVKESDNVLETDVRRAENQPRTGRDYRQGKDATPQMFLDTFGFRGVEFGNWVSQGVNLRERQGMLNASFDALMDLSDITGVPPEALSLNGELGLGMGSRGSGRASAHFEPDAIVINLTKTRGAGTLAHEWFHALDNYFSRMRGGEMREENYITYNPKPRTPIEGVRPEMEQRFAELVKVLNDSPMNRRVKLLDKGKGSEGYWSRVIERAARSFENYVIYKMGEKGYQNDYLANVATIEEFARDPGRYPYLLDEELKPIADAFDNLFGDIKTKPGENGRVVLFQSTNPDALFQDGGEIPTLPVGGYDQMAGNFDQARALDDIWGEKVRPILDAMQESALKPERTMLTESLLPDVRSQLDDYLRQIKGQMATANHATMRWAEGMRDYALLNYSRQYGFDKLLSLGIPYEFWMTRTMVNWVLRAMDRPAWFANYARLMQFHNTYVNNLPARLKDKYYVPMPFLPDWAGKGVWISPQQQLFPFANFLQPLQQMQTDQDQQVRNAERVVDEWQRNGKLNPDEAAQALATHAGNAWEKAVAEAKIRNADENPNGLDYFSTIMSPALYATIPYYLLTHKKLTQNAWPSGQLPITRFGSGLKTAFQGTSMEWLGNIAGGLAAPENAVRKTLKLSEFGDWGDYYIDRQLTNMAADGTISTDQARQAMIERKGPLYDQAEQRVRLELMLKTPELAPIYAAAHGAQFDAMLALAPSLFSGGLLPEGEIIVNGDKAAYNKAWDAYNLGNKKAINTFFDQHPEYEARLALYDNPDERLKNFMISEIWDRYGALGSTYKKQARAVLGPDFDVFLSNQGVEFPVETLAKWAQALGGIAPQPAENTTTTTTPAYTQAQQTGPIDWYPPEVAAVMDDYSAQRNEKFPNWYAIQTGYYSQPASEHAAYLMRFPALRKYWDWKKAYQAKYPGMEAWFDGSAYKNTDTSQWPPALVQVITDYAMTGTKLSKGAMKLLDTLWVTAGKPYDSAQSWLDTDVVPSILNQAMPYNQLQQNQPVTP